MPPTVDTVLRLRRQRGDDAGEVPGLLGRVLHAESVVDRTRLRLLACRVARLAVEMVHARERHVRVRRRHLDYRGREQEPDGDHEIVPVVDGRLQVRLVVLCPVRHVDTLLDVQIGFGLVEARDRELVEAAVVHTAGVRDEPDLDAVASPASAVVAAATRSAGRNEQRRDDDQNPRPSLGNHTALL